MVHIFWDSVSEKSWEGREKEDRQTRRGAEREKKTQREITTRLSTDSSEESVQTIRQ